VTPAAAIAAGPPDSHERERRHISAATAIMTVYPAVSEHERQRL
jgi:hypothetical protein